MDKTINADLILDTLKTLVESKKLIPRDEWLTIALKLAILRTDEAQLYNKMNQAVKRKEMDIYEKQDKKNKAAAELEVQTTDEYRFLRDQEDKLKSIDQFIQVSKKAADLI